MIQLKKDLVINKSKELGYQIETTEPKWPYNYAGNEAYLITDLKMKQVYVCFDTYTGNLIQKEILK